jgi:DNA-binding transcriptional MerR regulator
VTERSFRGPEVCRLAGITYRQLDYWARIGLVRPSVSDPKGSGTVRLYSADDVAVLRVISRTLASESANAGLHRLGAVVPAIRAAVEQRATDLVLVITSGGSIGTATTADELLELVQEHGAAFSVTGFDTSDLVALAQRDLEDDAAPAATGADVNTSAAVNSGAATAGL